MTRSLQVKIVLALLLIALVTVSYLFITRPKPSMVVINSSKTEIFHVPSCKWGKKVHKSHLRRFESARGAVADGLRPCRECEHLMIVPDGEPFEMTKRGSEKWEQENPD
jgi:hypothetical protein